MEDNEIEIFLQNLDIERFYIAKDEYGQDLLVMVLEEQISIGVTTLSGYSCLDCDEIECNINYINLISDNLVAATFRWSLLEEIRIA